MDKERVIKALAQIHIADGRSLIDADMVRALTVQGGEVSFVIEAPDVQSASQMEAIRIAAEKAVAGCDGIDKVRAILTAQNKPGADKSQPPNLKSSNQAGHHAPKKTEPKELPGIKNIIAIGSGKGGVGKSTLTANLAVALTRKGVRVGLLDADIYGPSQPRMMGVSAHPTSPDGKAINPLIAHGVTMMSIGLMVDPNKAVVWRGPMLMGALRQMLNQVRWGELDILLIDLPPGTGDVQLSLCQNTVLTGAILISTPQDIALLDVRKALDMFKQLNTPILGLVENMSFYQCPKCNHTAHIFGQNGVSEEAKRLGLPVLGTLPLNLEIRRAADSGTPIALSDDPSGEAYHTLAARVLQEIQTESN